jgi:hypothetical protein
MGPGIDGLPSEHLHALRRRTDAFELRQMWVKAEILDTPKQVLRVKAVIDLGRRRSPVGGCSRPQAKAIFDWHAKPGEQRAREAAETLTGRNGGIAMVQVFYDLSRFTILRCRVRGLPDVMMWTDKDQMIGIVEK